MIVSVVGRPQPAPAKMFFSQSMLRDACPDFGCSTSSSLPNGQLTDSFSQLMSDKDCCKKYTSPTHVDFASALCSTMNGVRLRESSVLPDRMAKTAR